MRHTLLGLAAALLASILASCASQPPAAKGPALSTAKHHASPSDQFPRPPELEPQIAFWRNVYGVWSRSQVVFHDDEHLGLIYEIVKLPDEIEEGYSSSQRYLVQDKRDTWRFVLSEMERKVAYSEPLTPAEQELAARFQANGAPIMGASERLRSQRGLRERFKRGLEISGRYDAQFRTIFRAAGLPEDIAYLPHVESSFQVNARSSAGAAGVWQFTKGAARLYMNNHPAFDERMDPVIAARGAARYLNDAYDKLGYWPLALTSYNHGMAGMMRAQEQFGNAFMDIVRNYKGASFGFASRNFYAEFLAARDVAKQPRQFFPEGVRYEPPLNWDRVVLRQDASVSELASYYNVEVSDLITLNRAWTSSAQNDRVALPYGSEVWLPAGTLSRMMQTGAVAGVNDGTTPTQSPPPAPPAN